MSHALKTRVLPGLRSKYTIVALPYWAWFWLDEHIEQHYPKGYSEFLAEVSDLVPSEEHLAPALQEYALLLHNVSMATDYNLSNDNYCLNETETKLNRRPRSRNYPRKLQLTAIYKLFGFMSCATTLEAVWQRRHYRHENECL